MAQDLGAYLETESPAGFAPRPYYGAEEDSLTFYLRNDESYARRIDERVTVFLSFDKDELVGCQVKGVRRHLQRFGDFGVHITKGKIRLGMFFHILAFMIPEPERRARYLELGQATKDVELDTGELVPP